jgi:hypothetical protein
MRVLRTSLRHFSAKSIKNDTTALLEKIEMLEGDTTLLKTNHDILLGRMKDDSKSYGYLSNRLNNVDYIIRTKTDDIKFAVLEEKFGIFEKEINLMKERRSNNGVDIMNNIKLENLEEKLKHLDEEIILIKKQQSNNIDLTKFKTMHTTCKEQLTKIIDIGRNKYKSCEAFDKFKCALVLTVINVGLIVYNIFKEKPKKYY